MNWRPSRGLMVALALSAVLMAAGCRKKSSRTTIVSSSTDIFTTDAFPGAPVQDGNVADDRRAMSPSAESVTALRCVVNGDRGTAMVIYTALTPPLGTYHVYAQAFDGERWTPPVPMQAADALLNLPAIPCDVAFLNTSGHPSAAARERDGDAVVLWMAFDQDGDGAATADGTNFCLFATYFDATHAADPSRRHGFQELATRLSVGDAAGEGSDSPAIVTDGLRGQALYRPLGSSPDSRYGDATTGLVVCWTEAEDNDVLNPAIEDVAAWFAAWDFDAVADPEAPLVPAPSARLPILGFGASDAGGSSEETLVQRLFLVYNNMVIVRVAADQDPASGIPNNDFHPTSLLYSYGGAWDAEDDVTLQCVAFDLDSGTPSAPQSLASGARDATDALGSQMMFLNHYDSDGGEQVTTCCYGSDEGLSRCVLVVAELAADPDTTDFGTGVADGVLKIIMLDEADGSVESEAAVNADDPSIFDSPDPALADTRISRNGDYIWIAFLQDDAAGASNDLIPRVAQFLTPRADDPAPLPTAALFLSATLTPAADVDGFDTQWIQFQAGLGYICGSQSDPDVINLFFEQSDATFDGIIGVRLEAGHDLPPVPDVSIFPVTGFADGEMTAQGPFVNSELLNFGAVDGGSAGNVVSVYRQDVDSTAATDFRLFARRSGGGLDVVEIGSGVPERQARSQRLILLTTPAGSAIGTPETPDDRPSPAEVAHVLFREDRFAPGTGTGPALRARAIDLRDPDILLDEACVPSVGAAPQPPFSLDLPNIDPPGSFAARVFGTGRDGLSVGVWFQESRHLYYQEFVPDEMTWLTQDGASDPLLVDDDSAVEVVNGGVWVFTMPATCEDLHGAIAFWLKDLDGGGFMYRLQVRIRD